MIYLDYQATTPLDQRVRAAMEPFFDCYFGNPHSLSHKAGIYSKRAVDLARQKIATALNTEETNIIFTSGATESNNLAILGIKDFLRENNKSHVITQVSEHACVLACFKELEREGFDVSYVSIHTDGIIDLEELGSLINEKTGLVSVMAVNNEIGTIQPLAEIAKLIENKNILFHSDAAQAVGRIPLDLSSLPLDLMSISGHKIYGPKGVGALYIRGNIKKHVRPIIHGGGQEYGLRSGTLPTPLCVGLAEAVKIAIEEQESGALYIKELRDLFLRELEKSKIPYHINGSMKRRIPGNLNISFIGTNNEDLIEALSELCISSGSACSTGKTIHSHVIESLGAKHDIIKSAVRISFGRFTKKQEILDSILEITKAYKLVA